MLKSLCARDLNEWSNNERLTTSMISVFKRKGEGRLA